MPEYVVTREVYFMRRLSVCPMTGDPNKGGWHISVPPDLGFSVSDDQYEALGSPVKGDFLKFTIEKVQSMGGKD